MRQVWSRSCRKVSTRVERRAGGVPWFVDEVDGRNVRRRLGGHKYRGGSNSSRRCPLGPSGKILKRELVKNLHPGGMSCAG